MSNIDYYSKYKKYKRKYILLQNGGVGIQDIQPLFIKHIDKLFKDKLNIALDHNIEIKEIFNKIKTKEKEDIFNKLKEDKLKEDIFIELKKNSDKMTNFIIELLNINTDKFPFVLRAQYNLLKPLAIAMIGKKINEFIEIFKPILFKLLDMYKIKLDSINDASKALLQNSHIQSALEKSHHK